jgi:hypothetical protein
MVRFRGAYLIASRVRVVPVLVEVMLIESRELGDALVNLWEDRGFQGDGIDGYIYSSGLASDRDQLSC